MKFGEFTLKSGRKSPFFHERRCLCNRLSVKTFRRILCKKAIHDQYGDNFDVLFGPAYKGIPLSVATTIAFYELYGKEIRYCSNRKEIKDHGDTGILLGSKIKDKERVVIIEDVTTSGKSIEETFPIIQAQGRCGDCWTYGFPKSYGAGKNKKKRVRWMKFVKYMDSKRLLSFQWKR